jgi:hypothetical protein
MAADNISNIAISNGGIYSYNNKIKKKLAQW